MNREFKTLFILVACLLFFAMGTTLNAMQKYWSDLPSTRTIERYDSLTGFDITKYVLTLTINDVSHHLDGNVKAFVTSESSLTSISYELAGGTLAVSQVLVNDSVSTFTHINGVITIPVNFAYGEQFTTQVFYSGTPALSPSPFNIGIKFNSTGVYTLSNPDAGRYYWPCYDHPWDKALIDMHITVRSDWLVAGNGIRQSITDNGNGTKTHFWSHPSPVATYVIGFAAAAFVEFNQSLGNLPIQNFVLPNDLADAQIDFANLPAMIDFFSQVYGPYPFEKYGHACMSISPYAAMEHQTMTLLGAGSLTGTQSSETVISHELGHQWFGDAVTPLSMVDVWLKEGFAVYSEFLWKHKKLGWAGGLSYLWSGIQNYYLNWEISNPTRVMYNPPYNNMFSPCTYEKGASVIHMMRLKMGSPTFFNFVQTWFNTHNGSNVITSEFEAMAEQISGQDFTQFFQQWVYSPGIPSAKLTYFTNGTGLAKIVGQTTSSSTTQFDIDIPLKLPGSALLDSVVVRATPNGFATVLPMNPDTDILTNILIDPNHWVLNRGWSVNTFQLITCAPANHRVTLTWTALASPLPLLGYNIYRKRLPEGTWTRLNMFPLAALTYTDLTPLNGYTYQYYVTAKEEGGFESLPSNLMSATPIEFPFDWGFLVVDETRDGTGSTLSPTDQMVDDFYASVLEDFNYTTWDYNFQGAPTLSTLSHYPMVLWHCDDYSEFYLDDAIGTLTSYVISGGKLLISGWKHPGALPQTFYDQWFNGLTPVIINQPTLTAAQSDFYQDLHPDPDKLTPVWNGNLSMAYIFPGATQVVYSAVTIDSLNGHGEPLAVRSDNNGTMVLLGFPLYYMLEDEVRIFLQQIIPQLYPDVANEDEVITPSALTVTCYPNPFYDKLNFDFNKKIDAPVRVYIYNIKGQKIRAFNSISGKGMVWDGCDENQHPVGAGVYLLKLETRTGVLFKKVMKLK
ncbi:MAG: M1 family aminopeptidase [Candidatus Cloacimonadaceae bacterium]